jgi:FKBP-type peptidyl-prolyl cis-trans isomerase FkpA
MRLSIAAAVSAAILLSACSQTSQNATPKTDDEKVVYGMGVYISEKFGLRNYEFTDQELAMLRAGLADGIQDKSKLGSAEELEKLLPKIQEFATKRTETVASKAAEKAKTEGTAYLAKAEKESGATKLGNGAILKITKEGTGAQPTASDTVKVNYEGKLISGKVFDSSIKRGEPAEFPLAGVVPCWTEAFQKLKVGAKAQLVCPSDVAYGPQGAPQGGIPGNSVLIFDVELLDIVKAEPVPAAPAAPAAAPKKAK